MDDISARRKGLFSGAKFSSALLYNGDKADGGSASFRYFSGCNVDGCYLVLKRSGGVMFTSEMNLSQARQESRYAVKLMGKDARKTLRSAAGRGKVGVDAGGISAARFLALRKRAKLKLVDAGGRMLALRGAKSPPELAALAASAKIARKILEELDPWECKTEEELANRLKIMALEAGADVSFEPIVATGRNSSMPHHDAGSKRLEDAVLVDFGVRYRGYCSDFTRCYFGKRGMKEQEAYAKCISVFEGMLDGLDGCRSGRDAALLSEKLMEKHGLPKMIHAIGHGIGLDVHEYPHLGKKSKDSLESAVLAIEPAAYFKRFGVRFEEMVANTRNGWKKI